MRRVVLWLAAGIVSSGCGTRTSLDLLARPLPDAAPIETTDAVVDVAPPSCARGIVATTQSFPEVLALDGVAVYWMDKGDSSVANDGRLARCPKSGCSAAPEVLHAPMTSGGGLAVDALAVYWTELGVASAFSCNKLICTPRTLFVDAADGPITLLADGASLDVLSYHSVETCPVAGCSAPNKLASLTYGALAIAADATSIYFTEASPSGALRGSIYACAKPACAGGPRAVATGLPAAPWGLAIDAANVYFMIGGAAADADGAGELRVCPKSGCGASPTTLVSGRNHPTNLVSDADRLYWIEQGTAARAFADGAVASCAKSGCAGAPTIVAASQYLPAAVALDEACVYWSTSGTSATPGTIQRAPKVIPP
ncbi:MAG: hypothetical protein ACHREM_02600 [Polyangiales bacterium]